MMADLLRQLRTSLRGRVLFVGLGNPEYGDDGFGVLLAQHLTDLGVPDVIIAGAGPDHWFTQLADPVYDHVVFLDAVEFGGVPGALIFIDRDQITSRFPQISTHKLSLGTLAAWSESNHKTKAWLLGVQPHSLNPPGLSPNVKTTLKLAQQLLSIFRPEEGQRRVVVPVKEGVA